MRLEFFTLVQNFLALAPNATATATVQVPSDAAFVWTHAHYMGDVAAAGQTDSTRIIPLVTMYFQNGASGRNLSNVVTAQNGIPISSMFGGQVPLALPKPLFFAANSYINLGVFNYDAAQTYNLRLALIGYKQFPEGV